MFDYDVRGGANRGDFDWCTHVSPRYGQAMVTLDLDLGKRPRGMDEGTWTALLADEANDPVYRAEGGVYIEEYETPVHITMDVCPVCSGRGSYVNPAIDAGGLSYDDLHGDPDFAEAYFSGAYDQPCNACGGGGKYPHLDRVKTPAWLVRLLDERAEDDAAYAAQCAAERRMGC